MPALSAARRNLPYDFPGKPFSVAASPKPVTRGSSDVAGSNAGAAGAAGPVAAATATARAAAVAPVTWATDS
jgi:hypothetical protein